jgi:uncharacterized protein YdhG (YjbR/CyaY superfamily)
MSRDDVDAYIAGAPEAQQDALREMRGMIRAALPHAEEGMSPNGFAVYTVDDAWTAGFATRAKGAMLYIMAPGVLDRYEDRLGHLRSGRSCIEYRASTTLTMDELRDLAREMLQLI